MTQITNEKEKDLGLESHKLFLDVSIICKLVLLSQRCSAVPRLGREVMIERVIFYLCYSGAWRPDPFVLTALKIH